MEKTMSPCPSTGTNNKANNAVRTVGKSQQRSAPFGDLLDSIPSDHKFAPESSTSKIVAQCAGESEATEITQGHMSQDFHHDFLWKFVERRDMVERRVSRVGA